MKIAICDDDRKATEYTEKLILEIVKDWETRPEIFCLSENTQMLDDIQKGEADVVLLDIDMPVVNGLEIANRLSECAPMVTIIFLTDHAELVFESLRYRPFRFIRKLRIKEELAEALEAARKKHFMETRVISLQNKSESIAVPVNRLIYIESRKHYLELIMKQKKTKEEADSMAVEVYKLRGKLSECEKKLDDFGFIRVHVGFLVNIRYISSIGSQMVTLDTGEKIPISRNRMTEVQRKYMWGMERYLNGYTL